MLKETLPGSGVIKLMEESGALLKGHFELASGLHSNRYIQCAKLLEDPARAEIAGKLLADVLRKEAGWMDEPWQESGGAGSPAGSPGGSPAGSSVAVVSPAVGGIVIGHEVARALGVRHIFAERVAGEMMLRRGFEIAAGEKVIVVEDVFTTGGSVKEVIKVIAGLGGEIVAVGSIVNRSTGVDFGVPTAYLVRAEIENHEPAECPLCSGGIEVTKPGTKRTQAGGK
jgi:orotate phosphoribosyltransferase